MRKKSITLVLIPFCLIFSVGLQSSEFLSVQSYIATDANNPLTIAATWTYATVISDDGSDWNGGVSQNPAIAIDSNGNLHVVWTDGTDGEWGNDLEIMYANNTGAGWSNATVISDDATGWNVGNSYNPDIAIDEDGNMHVVWCDFTQSASEWGIDPEIMYVNRTGAGWSNATVISDLYGWNDGTSSFPSIAIDSDENLHVVWQDDTDGEWDNDIEIMYANYTTTSWSNATVISDDATGWNGGSSVFPSIAIDNDGNVHVVWQDMTDGEWGIDYEIMYAKQIGAGWSNATVISDIYGWNDANSENPTIAIDGDGNLHVVWEDETDGEWGNDIEIMYTNHIVAGWSNATVISDDTTNWNNDPSYEPKIGIDCDGNMHVVWYDHTDGEWGTDAEIMYVNRTGAGWSNATTISGISWWNDGDSQSPSVAVDDSGNIYVVWYDDTNSVWGTDTEIMYSEKPAPQTRDNGPINLIIVSVPDSSILLLSPLGLGIIGIAVATAVIITLIITKKRK